MGEFPMSDERLAELERLAPHTNATGSMLELAAEVRRLREPIDRKALDHMAAERDAAFARVAELEEQVKLLSGANRQLGDKAERLERENDRLAASREHPHSARLAARIMRAEDRVEELEKENAELRTSELFCGVCAAGVESSEHHERCVQPLAASRSVLDDRDRLQDRVLAALAIRDEHRESGGQIGMQCVCPACQMGRALDGEPLRRDRP